MSLYGGDAEADYDAIVRLVGGRRVNLSEPARSLIVLKPTEFVEHGGGTVLSQESEALKLLLDWVRQGAPLATTRHLTRVEILPKRHVARSLGDPAPPHLLPHQLLDQVRRHPRPFQPDGKAGPIALQVTA